MARPTTALRGRKRFATDLAQLKDECKRGMAVQDLVIKGLKAGDDEGSLEFRLLQDGEYVLVVNLVVSDTTEYPDGHTCFSFTEEELSPEVTRVVEDVSSDIPRPLRDTVMRLASKISASLGRGVSSYESEEYEEGESDDAPEFEDFDHAYETFVTSKNTQQVEALRRDFLEVISAGYRPGITRWSQEEFVVCVSLPIADLKVPIAALATWDRRIISTHHHFTLLISGMLGTYPILGLDGSFTSGFSRIKLSVGFTTESKPSKEIIAEVTGNFARKPKGAEIQKEVDLIPDLRNMTEEEVEAYVQAERGCRGEDRVEPVEQEKADSGDFKRFPLSISLENLLEQSLVELIRLRLQFNIGWAGAEILLADALRTQNNPEEIHAILQHTAIKRADLQEATFSTTYSLPPDPLLHHRKSGGNAINFPLIAYSYLIRRLMLCSLYCLICHQRLKTDYVALKPYVCDSTLCAYQFYTLGYGPSIENEIRTNPEVVDLLVSLTYTSAREQQMDEGFPVGLGLRVPPPNGVGWRNQGVDGLVNFDGLTTPDQRIAIADMIDTLPKISEMKDYLDKQNFNRRKGSIALSKMKPDVLPAAWTILQWVVASCTASLEHLPPDERVGAIDGSYSQFRFSVGSPDAENKFSQAVEAAKAQSRNSTNYLSLYAFHGSALKNWHSIIRQGLQFKTIVNGRAFGHGVYFGRDGSISLGYCGVGGANWRNSAISPTHCLAIAEIVNLPLRFVSTNPYFVVNQTSWIMTRYLLVGSATIQPLRGQVPLNVQPNIPIVELDRTYPTTMNGTPISIPKHVHKLGLLLEQWREEKRDEDYDVEDQAVLGITTTTKGPRRGAEREEEKPMDKVQGKQAATQDWKHDPLWVDQGSFRLIPPPLNATSRATMGVQRELRTLLKEQENATSLRELGFYMPPDLIPDNLFQWIVELHSFDPNLPIAQDMKAKGCNSILFEIRFPSSFPLSPPFFRIIKPRFLAFIQGGGGHVTGGGSICIDLLTSDGWMPNYTISAILLQIKLAISNLEPRPARLAPNWNVPYGTGEALEGFKRAANTHGWKIPTGTDQLLSS